MSNGKIAFTAIVGLTIIAIAATLSGFVAQWAGKDVPPVIVTVGVLAVREMIAVVNTYTRAQPEGGYDAPTVQRRLPTDPGMGGEPGSLR